MVLILSYPIKHAREKTFNVQNPVHIISKQQITSSGSQSLLDAINSQSGVQIIEPNGTSGRAVFSMRGFGDNAASNVLMLLDELPYTKPDIGALELNALPLREIKQIEILPSSSVLYGDQAVGGIINIVTNGLETKPNNEISVSYGSAATHREQFFWGGGNKDELSCRIGATNYASNNYRRHNAESTNNFFVNLAHQDLYFNYRKINQHLEMSGKLTWQQVEEDPRQAENDISYNNQDNDIFSLGLKHIITENWLVKLDSSWRLLQGVGAYAFNQRSVLFDESRQVATIRPKITGVINVNKYLVTPIFGADLSYGKYSFNSSLARQDAGAIYGHFTIPLTQKITFALGSRYGLAYYNLTQEPTATSNPINRAFITDLEFSWQLFNNLRLFAKRAENYRFPKTDEILFTSDGQPLKTQKGVSYEIGGTYKNNNFTGSVTIYQLNLKNEIVAVPLPTSNYFIYNENLDLTRRIGTILDLSFEPIKYLHISTNYNFVNAKFIAGNFVGNTIPFVADHTLRLGVTIKPSSNLHLLVEGLYTGKRYSINDVENRTPMLGGFTIYNCGITYEKLHYILTLRGNNLTNKLYYGYTVVTYQGISSTTWYYPATGFNMLATFIIKINT